MAMSGQPSSPATLNGTTAVNITDSEACQQANMRAVVRVAADGAFRLNLIASDTSGNDYVVKQVASGVVTVDGATAGYVNVAEFSDIPVPAAGRFQIYNPAGGAIHWVADWRIYE